MTRKTNSLLVAGLIVGLLPMSAQAADADEMIGLIVSGVVEKSAGVQIIDVPNAGPLSGDSDATFWSGTSGRMSLPLAPNLSIQSDVDVEYNDRAFDSGPDEGGLRYGFQGGVHVSVRDPSQGLIGGFGGAGGSHYAFANSNLNYDFRFVGGEIQGYFGDFTLYAQGGYIDIPRTGPAFGQRLDDGYFARGVARWFFNSDSRLQVEAGYAELERNGGGGQGPGPRDLEVLSWGARYDTQIAGLPFLGDSNVFIGYRGMHRENCYQFAGGSDLTDHTIMAGFTYHWGATTLLDNDRRGATLDLPAFANMITCGGPGGEEVLESDARLKTNIKKIGQTESGLKLYAWKYKKDPVTTWVGVIAQDLETTHPEALVVGADGFYRVNYFKLGAQMMTLEQWNARHL